MIVFTIQCIMAWMIVGILNLTLGVLINIKIKKYGYCLDTAPRYKFSFYPLYQVILFFGLLMCLLEVFTVGEMRTRYNLDNTYKSGGVLTKIRGGK